MKSWMRMCVLASLALIPIPAAADDWLAASIPTEPIGLSDRINQSRVMVIAVDATSHLMRVRGADGSVYAVSLPTGTMVVGASHTGPGDVVRIERPAKGPTRVHVLRAGWRDIGSPED